MNKQETIIHGSFTRGFQVIKVSKKNKKKPVQSPLK